MVARLIFLAMASASSITRIRAPSAGSDLLIFLLASLSDMTRVAGPAITGSVIGK